MRLLHTQKILKSFKIELFLCQLFVQMICTILKFYIFSILITKFEDLTYMKLLFGLDKILTLIKPARELYSQKFVIEKTDFNFLNCDKVHS